METKYRKLTQQEHVLERPTMYVGETQKKSDEVWYPIFENDKLKCIKELTVEYSKGFVKIFDEILINALDNYTRDIKMKILKVDICNDGYITIYNDGTGIPVQVHSEYQKYIPEIIFGELLTGENYNDDENRLGAGMYGLGSKLTNIFSKLFEVEIVDSITGTYFYQKYTDNMTKKSNPIIRTNPLKFVTGYTKISFLPDFSRFGMKFFEESTASILKRRVYDVMIYTDKSLSIYLNGIKLTGNGLLNYSNYFFDGAKSISETQMCDDTFLWQYGIFPSETGFHQVSFVNSVNTTRGGRHVDHIINQIISKYKKRLEEKKKLKEIKNSVIKDKIFLFLAASVRNPVFDTQTKEQLISPIKDVNVSNEFIDKLFKSPITNKILQSLAVIEEDKFRKVLDAERKLKIVIPKLEDALMAGEKNRTTPCTLILTEGDSAATFAIWGRTIVGSTNYGIFPLKGKLLNVRDATNTQLMNNQELKNLIQIIGLRKDKEYLNTKELRYDNIIILTDADVDGAHIKGLIINLFHYWWPSLLKLQFISSIKTPIIKITCKGKIYEFFNDHEYSVWTAENNIKNCLIRYYKGLGTSNKQDAQYIFKNLSQFLIHYYYKNSLCDTSILLAFEKDKNVVAKNMVQKFADMRKDWLVKYDKTINIPADSKLVSYQDFINKDLIHFSAYNTIRTIPNICDGLKPSQRKILFYILEKNKNLIKVAQLSGYVSAETNYHHGENSLQETVINMAQNFVGSNNINLLIPEGNFGTRYQLGADAASPRYIFTKLNNITEEIYNKLDFPLSKYIEDEGSFIEPEYYVPIIPMVLVNGCEGIATGYSTFIPPHNPKDIINSIRESLINSNKPKFKKFPWYKGFRGEIKDLSEGRYEIRGLWKLIGEKIIQVTELPVNISILSFKEHLENLVGDREKRYGVKKFSNKSTDDTVDFIIEFFEKISIDTAEKLSDFETKMKLIKIIGTNNMYLFTENLQLRKYDTIEDILIDFYNIRFNYYILRKDMILRKNKSDLTILTSKQLFIREYMHGTLEINNQKKAFIENLLNARNYPTLDGSYNYLMDMPIYSFTSEKLQFLGGQILNKRQEIQIIESKTPANLWIDDLDRLEKILI